MNAESEKPYILLYDKKVSTMKNFFRCWNRLLKPDVL